MRYNVQGAPNEPLPIYVQPILDGTGMKVAWTDNATAGIFNADRCHLTELQLDPTTAGGDRSSTHSLCIHSFHWSVRSCDGVNAAHITEAYYCTPTWIMQLRDWSLVRELLKK